MYALVIMHDTKGFLVFVSEDAGDFDGQLKLLDEDPDVLKAQIVKAVEL